MAVHNAAAQMMAGTTYAAQATCSLAGQAVKGTYNLTGRVVRGTAHVGLSCTSGVANIGKKITPVLLGIASLGFAFDTYALMTNHFQMHIRMNPCSSKMPLAMNLFTVIGTLHGEDCEKIIRETGKFGDLFVYTPYLAVGCAVAAFATYVILDNVEKGAQHYRKKLEHIETPQRQSFNPALKNWERAIRG